MSLLLMIEHQSSIESSYCIENTPLMGGITALGIQITVSRNGNTLLLFLFTLYRPIYIPDEISDI